MNNRVKKYIFTSLMLLIPVIFILSLEFAMRIVGFGDDTSLFIKYHENDDYMAANQSVAKRYFSSSQLPGFGTVDVFRKEKQNGTKRIFVLGGSTTASFPYYFNGAFSTRLRVWLEHKYPGTKLEMINVGMTAVNSFTVRDFALECLEYDPDLLVVYTGHNEFYGALGSASSEGALFGSIGGRKGILASIWIKQTKLYQAMKMITSSLVKKGTGDAQGNETMMTRMVKEASIPYGSEIFEKTHRFFKKNLEDIIKAYSKNNIPVIITTVASNFKDQKPFVSVLKNENRINELEAVENDIKDLMLAGDIEGAIQTIKAAINEFPEYALLYFYLGKAYELSGDLDKALEPFMKAKDLDGLRFRASSEINNIIRDLSKSNKVTLVDIDSIFINRSDGPVGKKLMLEHLHPNLEGHNLIASSLVNPVAEILNLVDGVDVDIQHEDVLNLFHFTGVDSAAADIRIKVLMSGWPFKNTRRSISLNNIKTGTIEQEYGLDILKNKKSYWDAHTYIAENYSNAGNDKKALVEYKALAQAFPESWKGHKLVGWKELSLGNSRGALLSLEKAANLGGDFYCQKMTGALLLNENEALKARKYLERAMEMNPEDIQNRYNLAGAYYLSGEMMLAETMINFIIEEAPEYLPAREFLERLNRSKGN